MKPPFIRAELQVRGFSQRALADRLNLDASTVGQVISGRKRSARIAAEISKIVGATVDEIWPGQYASEARPRVRRGSR